jgi:hypothetical protein
MPLAIPTNIGYDLYPTQSFPDGSRTDVLKVNMCRPFTGHPRPLRVSQINLVELGLRVYGLGLETETSCPRLTFVYWATSHGLTIYQPYNRLSFIITVDIVKYKSIHIFSSPRLSLLGTLLHGAKESSVLE